MVLTIKININPIILVKCTIGVCMIYAISTKNDLYILHGKGIDISDYICYNV